MPPNTKALLVFAGRFLLVFFLILPLWFVITPGYNRLLASCANILLTLTEDPHVHRLVGWKYFVLITRLDSPFTEGMKVQAFTGYLTHFNLILMTGLVLAQQHVAWRRRCVILAVALSVLFITHILYLVIGVKFFEQPELEAFQSTAGRVYVWGVNFYLSIVAQLVPVLIWMALYRTLGEMSAEVREVDEESASGRRGKASGRRKADRVP
ncbi:MAG TPA: hypothetical protein VN444_02700 [Verrucomicrobiae bacterium]|nr:hypothetical protein [Verrucomicrobiae bacterium]